MLRQIVEKKMINKTIVRSSGGEEIAIFPRSNVAEFPVSRADGISVVSPPHTERVSQVTGVVYRAMRQTHANWPPSENDTRLRIQRNDA